MHRLDTDKYVSVTLLHFKRHRSYFNTKKQTMKKKLLFFCLIYLALSLHSNLQAVEKQEYEVRIHTPDASVILAGTLLVPKETYDGTVVLMITGSGDHSRDQVISGTPMFKVMAEELAKKGIASLRLDDRGTEASTGPTTMESTTADRVEDMIAAIEWLRKGDVVKFNNIGVLGHSEGALVTIKMASREIQPDFAIMLGAPTQQGSEVWVSQQIEGLKSGEFHKDSIINGEKYLKEAVRLTCAEASSDEMMGNTWLMFNLIGMDMESEEGMAVIEGFISYMNQPWMRYFLNYNPTNDLNNFTIPLLAIYGSHDFLTIPGLNAPSLMEGLLKAGNNNFTIKIMPEQDHFFLRKPGEPVGMHFYEEMVLSDELIQEISQWIKIR
jgi:uncharacterized protein